MEDRDHLNDALNNLPCVAILIPITTVEFLNQTLKSVEGQHYPRSQIKIILVTTGLNVSDVKELIPKSLNEITSIYDCAEKGIANGLNFGLSKIDCEFVARIDGDDLMHPDRIFQQVVFLLNNPDFSVVGSQLEIIDSSGETRSIKKYPTKDRRLRREILKKSPLAHPAVMFKKSKVIQAGGYRNMPSEDTDLWIRIMENGRIANLEQILTKYRIHDRQSSNSFINFTDLPRRIVWTSHLLRMQNLEDFPSGQFEWVNWLNDSKKLINPTWLSRILLSDVWEQDPVFISKIHSLKRKNLIFRLKGIIFIAWNEKTNFYKWMKLKLIKYYYFQFFYLFHRSFIN